MDSCATGCSFANWPQPAAVHNTTVHNRKRTNAVLRSLHMECLPDGSGAHSFTGVHHSLAFDWCCLYRVACSDYKARALQVGCRCLRRTPNVKMRVSATHSRRNQPGGRTLSSRLFFLILIARIGCYVPGRCRARLRDLATTSCRSCAFVSIATGKVRSMSLTSKVLSLISTVCVY